MLRPDGLDLRWTPTATGFEARVQASDVSLAGAIEIEPPAGPPTVSTTRHKNGDVFFEINDVAPALNDRALNPRRVRVYWDHSLSRRDDNLALERELLHRYVDAVSPGIVDLVLFSDHGPELQTFEAPSMGERLDDVLRNITYAGATSLEDVVDVPLPTAEACFFFSDGTISIDSYILERVHCPIFTVSTAADAERGFLSVLAKRSAGAYFDLTALDVDAVLARLTSNSPRVVSVTTPEGRAIDYAVLPAASERFRIVGLAPMSGDVVVTLASGTKRIRAYAISRRATIPTHDAMGALWAADRAAELGATDRPDKDAIVALSRRYSVATDAAVFIVFETGYDYAYAGIEPPPSIGERELAHYRQAVSEYQDDKRKEQADRLGDVVKRWRQEKRWWQTDFSKPLSPDMEEYDDIRGTVLITASQAVGRPGDASDITVAIEPWNPDRPYLTALEAAAPDTFMAVYREQEAAFGSLPAFYLDVAEFLYRHDRADDAIMVALNALELPSANTATMTILAERLMKYGDEGRALWLLERIAYLEPDRPQPLRTLALALMQRADRKEGIPIVAAARRKDYSRALDLLNEIVTRTWDGYNDELDLVALMEANRIVPRLSGLGVTKIPLDPRLVAPLDVDLRAVLEWDTDASDVDLWIDEPNGTRAKWSRSQDIDRRPHQQSHVMGLRTRGVSAAACARRHLHRPRRRVVERQSQSQRTDQRARPSLPRLQSRERGDGDARTRAEAQARAARRRREQLSRRDVHGQTCDAHGAAVGAVERPRPKSRGRLTSVQLRQAVGEDIFAVVDRGEQVAARLVHHALQPVHVEADDLAAAFPDAAADDHGVDIAALGRLDHRPQRVVRRVEIDVVAPDHDDVGLLAGRERADLVGKPCAARSVDRRAFEHVAHAHRPRQIHLAGEAAVLQSTRAAS